MIRVKPWINESIRVYVPYTFAIACFKFNLRLWMLQIRTSPLNGLTFINFKNRKIRLYVIRLQPEVATGGLTSVTWESSKFQSFVSVFPFIVNDHMIWKKALAGRSASVPQCQSVHRNFDEVSFFFYLKGRFLVTDVPDPYTPYKIHGFRTVYTCIYWIHFKLAVTSSHVLLVSITGRLPASQV